MNATGYIIDTILVLLVIRQIRGSRLDLLNLVLPVVLVIGAAAYYLRSVPTAGNDVALDLALAATGAALGILCAVTTHLRRDADGLPFAWAGLLAAVLWIVGIGSRLGFAFFSTHGAGPAILRFSVAHSITGANAWTAALVMMALAEVTGRLIALRLRASRLPVPVAPAGVRTPAKAQA